MKLIIVKTIYGDYIMNDELTIYKEYATRFYSVTRQEKWQRF